jgi:DNA-binding XRE family transcriptional regulator
MHVVHRAFKCTRCIYRLDVLMHVMHHAGMTKLAAHLSAVGMSQRAFAAAIGVDPSIISRLSRKEMTPSLTLAVAIERATQGAVPADCWVDADKKLVAE